MGVIVAENLVREMEFPAQHFLGPDVTAEFVTLGRNERNLSYRWALQATLNLRLADTIELTSVELKTLSPDEIIDLLKERVVEVVEQMKERIDPVRRDWYPNEETGS